MILSILTFLLLSCSTDTPVVPQTQLNNPVNMKFLALGDSYTIGESVKENERWPNLLTQKLINDKVVISDTTQIIAVTGWTTKNLLNGIANTKPDNDYDLVSLLIGVNNYYQFKEAALPDYEKEFVQLLDSAVKFAGGMKDNVFVVSIPDYAYTPFGGGSENISKGIDLFNASNKKLTAEAGITYINITPISRQGLDYPALVASDGLHPSAKQYKLWVELMYPAVKQKLDN